MCNARVNSVKLFAHSIQKIHPTSFTQEYHYSQCKVGKVRDIDILSICELGQDTCIYLISIVWMLARLGNKENLRDMFRPRVVQFVI